MSQIQQSKKFETDQSLSEKEEDNEMETKFNNLETEENPQHTQFLFCKHYSNVNY